MKINSGEIVKTMRREMGLSQESLAEQLFISVRQLARIESGEASMDVWQFISALELLGRPTEDFWLLYLSSSEYAGYRDFKRLKRQLKNGDISDIKEAISNIKNGPLIKQPFIMQLVAMLEILIRTDASPSTTMVEELLNVLRMSKPLFDEAKISTYRMTYNEIYTVLSIAECLATLNEHSRAVSMIQAIITGRENAHVSEEDKGAIFPALYFSLARTLSSWGKFGEGLKACHNALEVCREFNNMKNIPDILRFAAICQHRLGEEEHVYKTYFIRAYHSAYALGRNDTAKAIKEEVEKEYGLSI